MPGPGIRPVDNDRLVGGGPPDRRGKVPVEGTGEPLQGRAGKNRTAVPWTGAGQLSPL